MEAQRGQGTVEWVGLVALVSLLAAGLLAAGVRVPGGTLARAVFARLVCAVAFEESCRDEPALVAAYGEEVGALVRRQMPALAFERGSRALPVDYRRCRSSGCGDGEAEGVVARSDADLPVTAFVHVVDCRAAAAPRSREEGFDCGGARAGNLYISYWTYYADSATLRGVPVVGKKGYHRDDWESIQLRFGRGGEVAQRASSHNGYNYGGGVVNWASDAGLGALNDVVEGLGARPEGGWGPRTGVVVVSGGSHAGRVVVSHDGVRFVPGRRVHLIPLEPIAAAGSGDRFEISPPWLKRVWRDPEAAGTN